MIQDDWILHWHKQMTNVDSFVKRWLVKESRKRIPERIARIHKIPPKNQQQ